MIKHVFSKLKNAKFITFEDRETLGLFNKDVKGFIEVYIKDNKYLFIDEFQYAKEGGKQLKYIYDTTNIKIIITGSSAPDLTIQSIKYLVGRIFVFNLYPLSFEEYLRFKEESLFNLFQDKNLSEPVVDKINEYYGEFAIYGGYPRVVLVKSLEEKEEVLRGIYNTYFLREIKEILHLSDDFKLAKLIKLLALQIDNLTNYSELSSAADFNYSDLLKNLNILKQTFVTMESRPFFVNKKKEIIKTPKIFFLDNGFRNFILKNSQKIEDRTDGGALHENFAASELTKRDLELKYWRTKVGAEVDFVIEKEGQLIPIEVKSGLKAAKVTRSFRNFVELYKPKKSFILSRDFEGNLNLGKSKIFFELLFKAGKLVK